MFESNSRYEAIETATFTNAQGKQFAYKRRRFLPQGKTMPLLTEILYMDGDRLDLITNRAFGDSEQFWRICDANDTLNPTELTAEPGSHIRIPIPQPPTG